MTREHNRARRHYSGSSSVVGVMWASGHEHRLLVAFTIPKQTFGPLVATFETSRRIPTMSVYRGRPEAAGTRSKRRF
jgi:hypothetical protein